MIDMAKAAALQSPIPITSVGMRARPSADRASRSRRKLFSPFAGEQHAFVNELAPWWRTQIAIARRSASPVRAQRTCLFVFHAVDQASLSRGTESSNAAPSTSESAANPKRPQSRPH
jgi:hypothetical protein